MRQRRVKLTLWMMIGVVAMLAVAMGGLVALRRESISQYRQAMASYEADYSRACLRRVPEDVLRAFICRSWAAEGRKRPFRFVVNSNSSDMVNREQVYRKIVMESVLTEFDGTPDTTFRGWARESIWWAREAVRDVRRTAWHASMSKQYELAASVPTSDIPPEPPEPFPDL